MPEKQFNLSDRQKIRLQELADRDLAITRGMLYNQLQEWKRRIYDDQELNVNGKVWEAMKLTEGDIKFINQELTKLIKWEYTNETLIELAKSLHAKLKAVSNPTFNQKNLLEDLESALTIDGAPF
jgi:hypothetical protein